MCYGYLMETSTTTEHNIRERPKDRFRAKTRVFSSIGTEIEEPKGPLCQDPDCESWYCKNGHPEVNHAVWKAFLRYVQASARARLVPILAEYLDVEPSELKIRWSAKAGCSCGCSPGWIIDEPANVALRLNDIWVD